MNQFFQKDKLEVGIDEVGRGCLFGPVYSAAVIWVDEDPNQDIIIKDSKKCTEKYRNNLYNYIKENSISYSIQSLSNDYIDKLNILESTYQCMHLCLDDISSKINYDHILIDGDKFKPYYNKYNRDFMKHYTIINGDNKYKSIACASILAKVERDNYILKLCEEYPELKKYDIHNNKGYGTKKHIDAIKEYGITQWHRKTFGICKEFN